MRRRWGSIEPAARTTTVIMFESGDTTMDVSRFPLRRHEQSHGPDLAVDDVEDVVRTLKAKGVTSNVYDLPDTRREGDVHVSGDFKVASFKDPDGNILSLVNR